MTSEWQSYRLGDLFNLVNGFAFKGGEFKSSGIPVIKIKNVKSNNLLLSDLAFVDKDVADKRPDKELRRGDILITMSGNRMDGSRDTWVGKVAYFDIPGRYMLNQRVGVLRPKNDVEVDRKCCSYFLSSDKFQDFFIAVATSSGGQANLSPSQILGEKINLPPLAEQKQIASLLTSLDDRITLLRETNQTLEAIAKALFKSWFVDFEPVRAKAEGKVPEGIDAATAALFPDAFEESELGMVPKGWEVTSVGAIAQVVKGKSYSSKDLASEHTTALVTLKSFERGGGFRMDGFKPYTGAYKPTQVVSAGDLIVAYTDVTQAAELIGKPAIVVSVDEYDTLVASLDVGIVRPDLKKCGRQFLYGLFKTDSFQSHTFAHTSGTTVLHLSKDGVGSYNFALPPAELGRKFEEIASAIAERNQINADSIRTLGALRDTLLPRLISGQLQIPDAEQAIEKATA